MQISEPTDQDTPKRRRLKKVVFNLTTANELKAKQIKVLRQKIRRQKKKIISLKQMAVVLEKNNLLNGDSVEILMDSFGKIV